MVTLRIWYPSARNKSAHGASSLSIMSAWGGGYISTRPVKQDGKRRLNTPTATLEDDVEAEGGDTKFLWLFHRLDEGRMLRFWGSLQGVVAKTWNTNRPQASFHMCDMILAAGRGFDVEDSSAATLTGRAKGATEVASLAVNYRELAARADHYLKFEHW